MDRVKTAVLISGSGTNLQALIDAAADSSYPAVITLVISNIANAYGLKRAQKAGIATAVISHKEYPTREAFDETLHQCLSDNGIEIVCLAGFMRILGAGIVKQWEGRMLNIHPSLLPRYKGVDAQKQALEDGATRSGCSVHYVTADLDAGPVIVQREVPVQPHDTVATLSERILAQEHVAYPQALAEVARSLRHSRLEKTTKA